MRNSVMTIGAVQAEPAANRLLGKAGEDIHTEPKVMDLLMALAARPNEVCSRDELIDAVWNIDYGGDESLTRAVSQLRKAFEKLDPEAVYIETIPRRGYRLIAPVAAAAFKGPARAPPTLCANGALNGVAERRSPQGWILRGLLAAAPVTAFFIAITLAPALKPTTPGAAEISPPSIAVMPFKIIGEETGQQHLADGVAEEIVHRLAQIEDLGVVGRTMTFAIGDDGGDLRDIGARLGVTHILDGSLRLDGDRLRITAQLIDTQNGFHLWSDSYDRNITEVFALQDDIAAAVAHSLTLRLSPIVGSQPTPTGPRFFELYSLGLQAWRQRNVDEKRGAIGFFEQVLALDPDFHRARGYLAHAYVRKAVEEMGVRSPREIEFQQKAFNAAQRVLADDPNDAKALSALAGLRMLQTRWIEARHFAEAAVAADPHEFLAQAYMASIFMSVGDYREAKKSQAAAVEYNPYSSEAHYNMGRLYYRLQEFENAAFHFALSAQFTEAQTESLEHQAASLAALGQIDEAMEIAQELGSLIGPHEAVFYDFLRGHGDPVARARFVAWSVETGELLLLPFLSALGEERAVIVILEQKAALGELKRAPLAWSALWLPAAGEFRKTPAFKEFIRAARLPEYWREYGWPEHCRPVGDDDFECA